MRNQKGFAHIFILLLLLAGLAVAVYLVGQKTGLISKASNSPIVFKSLDGKPLPVNSSGIPQTTSPEVTVELTSTLGSPVTISGPVASPNQTGTVGFRTAFDPSELSKVAFTNYVYHPYVYSMSFKNTLGIQFYWVEFKGANGKLDRRSAQIEIVNSYVSGPITATPIKATPTPVSFVCTACAADIVKDARNQVNVSDYSVLSTCFNQPLTKTLSGGRTCEIADINKDGSVNNGDYDCLKSVYQQKCSVVLPTPTPTSTQFTCNACAADINKDKRVNARDYASFSTCWGASVSDTRLGISCASADINGNGKVDQADASCLRSQYGKMCNTSAAKRVL